MKRLSSNIKKTWNFRNWISNALHHRSTHFLLPCQPCEQVLHIDKEMQSGWQSDLQLLILCKNWSNSIYWNAGFSERDRTQAIFLSLYFVPRQKICKATKTKNRHKHNPRSRQSPDPIWKCQSMRTLCLKQRLCILFGGFVGNATHPSEFWKATIELWREKNMYRHVANFHLALQHEPPPRH